jgi:hypothetical protein
MVATLLIPNGAHLFTYLGPLYAVCAVGTVRIVRKARNSS